MMVNEVPRWIDPSCEALVHCSGVRFLKKQAKSKKPLIVGLATLAIIGLTLSLKLPGTTENNGDATKISPANGSAKRIALVPFRNIGPQQEDSFLAEGMH